MRKVGGVLTVVACFILALPHLAWSVAGNVAVNVTTREGPVAKAKVKLVPTDQLTEQGKRERTKEVETDQTGAVVIPVEEGNYSVQVTTPDGVRDSQLVFVKGGETKPVNFSLLPALPLMTQNPGGKWGLRIGGFGLFERDDLRYTREVETFFVSGSPVATFLDLSPNTFEARVNAGGVDAALGFPGFMAFGWRFAPSGNFMIGGADAEIKNATNNFTLAGPGFLVGGGVELAAVPSSLPQFYMALGWQGTWLRADDIDAENQGINMCGLIFPTASSCRNNTDLTSETHELFFRTGYSFLQNRLVPFAGVKVRWSDMDVKIDTNAVISGTDVRHVLDIDFERDQSPTVLGIAGFDFRFPDVGPLGRIVGRLQSQFNDDGFDILFKLMYEFDFAG